MLAERLLPKFRDLIPADAILVIGYSGGPDSTCLLHLLHEAGYNVIAAHLHHGMRAEAEQEANLCEAFARQLDIPFVLGRADVPLIAKNMKIGLEEAGRYARYEFFEQTRRAANAGWIATAHTRTDLAETVLLNLTRGCGLRGAAGIPERRDAIIRPLLSVSREETQAYCQEHGFWTHDDPANTDPNFSRVKIRTGVLPLLETVNPEAQTNIARFAEIAKEEDGFLDSLAVSQMEAIERPVNGCLEFLTRRDEIALHREGLLRLHPVLRGRTLRLLSEALGGEARREALLELQRNLAQATGGATLTGGLQVSWDPEMVLFTRQTREVQIRQPLEALGVTEFQAYGWAFEVAEADSTHFMRPRDSLEVVVDPDAIKGNLHVRTPQPGEALIPLGMAGSKLLSDLLNEGKLTALARQRIPMVCDMVGPIWVPTLAIADRVKITETTTRGLSLAVRAY